MQQFKVPVSPNRRTKARAGALEALSLDELSALLPAGHYNTISELGSGNCTLAPHFFTGRPPTHFRCFESEASLLQNFRTPAEASSDQITVSLFDPANGLPIPNGSQDLLLTSHFLEYLRMDELYMTCHEARRVVKSGGLWALASLTLPRNAILGLWQSWKHPGQALDLTHYISPEDWRTRSEKTFTVQGLQGQVLLLERTS
ncbi:MAG: class I SAM-dependent methyltransferase [Bdellovibrionota bacterium]